MSAGSRGSGSPVLLNVPRFAQPDDTTCGPTCLTQVFRYYGLSTSLDEVIRSSPKNPDGGTLGVLLGTAAIRLGFQPTLYSYNQRVFDPTWRSLPPNELIGKLLLRREAVKKEKLRRATEAYANFVSLGGRVRFNELNTQLIRHHLERGHPVLTGLSATYLYRIPREFGPDDDDIRGSAMGHFVVICGYYPKSDRFVVRDPSPHIPFSRSGRYSVPSDRLINSILLGDITYDAVLLVLNGRKHVK